MDEVKVI